MKPQSASHLIPLVVAVGLCAAGPAAEQTGKPAGELQAAVEKAIGRLKTTVAAAVVLDNHGRVLAEVEPDRPLKPASTLKVCTALAALDVLGASAVCRTRLIATGPVRDGTLEGDLILEGGADPTLSGRLYNGDPQALYRRWAAELRQAGIRGIAGRVVGDGRIFDDQLLAAGWENTDLTRWYAGRVTGLAYNDNCVDVVLRPGAAAGAPARLSLEPPCRFLTVENRVTTTNGQTDGRMTYTYTDRPDRVLAEGRLATGAPLRKETLALPNPTWWAAAALTDVLLDEGIPVAGEPADAAALANPPRTGDGTVLVTHTSPPLVDLVRIMNVRSQNHFADLLLKRLGLAESGKGSFAAGAAAVRGALARRGIDVAGLYQVDGSGLSHDNRVTARLLAEVLARGREVPEFLDSLPFAGDRDGGMRNYLGQTPAQQKARSRVRGKTGTITTVRALAGYVEQPDGGWLAYAIVLNNLPNRPGAGTTTIHRVLDVLIAYR